MAIQRVSCDRVGALLFVGKECFDDVSEPRGASAVDVVPGSLNLLQLARLSLRRFPTSLFGRPAGLLAVLVGLIPDRWADVDYDSQQIFVRRSWTGGKVGKPKSAASKAPVPLVPLLTGFIRQWQEQTPYGRPTDWVFASTRLKGKQPRLANMLVADHLRPAAVKAGVLKEGEKVRFGFHNLRHSLASFLVRKETDVKTVQKMLRHSDVATTIGIYSHSMSEDRLAAQDDMLAAMMTPSNAVN
jgi:hypothetical protein